jgi:hypothetical protein
LISGLFLPAVVRPILDSFETAKQVPQPALSDVCTFVLNTFNLLYWYEFVENDILFYLDSPKKWHKVAHFYWEQVV